MGRLGAPNREQQKEKPWKTGEKLGVGGKSGCRVAEEAIEEILPGK